MAHFRPFLTRASGQPQHPGTGLSGPARGRRSLLILGASGVAAPGLLLAQDRYPSRPVRLVIPFTAGGIGDKVGRMLAQRLGDILGQQVVVENPAGGDAVPGTTAAARAPADGYTILQVTGTQIINPVMREKVSYDLLRDFTPIVRASFAPLMLAVPASSPYTRTGDLVAAAKGRNPPMVYGSGGVGSLSHLCPELFKRAAGIEAVHAPYKGYASMMPDLIAGRLDFAFVGQSDVLPLISSGRLRALGVTSTQRVPVMPELQTMVEQGYKGMVAVIPYGYMVPRGTPDAIVRQLQAAITRALSQPSALEQMSTMGVTPWPGGPEDLAEMIRTDMRVWGQVIREANIKAD